MSNESKPTPEEIKRAAEKLRKMLPQLQKLKSQLILRNMETKNQEMKPENKTDQ